jgi:hypothetical protein
MAITEGDGISVIKRQRHGTIVVLHEIGHETLLLDNDNQRIQVSDTIIEIQSPLLQYLHTLAQALQLVGEVVLVARAQKEHG